MRAKRLTWKGETTHQEGRIDPGRIPSKGETTRGEGVKRAKRPDAATKAGSLFPSGGSNEKLGYHSRGVAISITTSFVHS